MIGKPTDHSSRLARGELADEERTERLATEQPDELLRRREFLARTAALAGATGLATVLPAEKLVAEAARRQLSRLGGLPSPRNLPLDTIVVLMMENRSFDHYFGWHPDADAKNAGLVYPDAEGNPVPTHRLVPDFQGCGFRDPDHSWDGGRHQYNDGAMDGFVQGNAERTGSDEFAAGYYLKQDVPFIPHAARAFTLYDRYFHSLMASTWPNRLYQWSATSGGNKDNGGVLETIEKGVTGDGLYPWETIFERAISRGVSARYYYSDLPFGGVFGRDVFLKSSPVAQFYLDAALGQLPNICFVDPPFRDGGGGDGTSADEHPHGDIRLGQAFMSDIVHAFIESPQYRRGALFINYDEWGGFFEHVPPRIVPDDRESTNLYENFGLTGFRIPGVAVSPFARGGGVSHKAVTHESILQLISYRFGLGHLNKRHRHASNIGESLDFSRRDFEPPNLPDPLAIAAIPCTVQELEGEPTPAPHDDIAVLETSGYLERIGAKVYKPTPERIFRNPDAIKRALRESTRSRRSSA